jgi:hypothetical protein
MQSSPRDTHILVFISGQTIPDRSSPIRKYLEKTIKSGGAAARRRHRHVDLSVTNTPGTILRTAMVRNFTALVRNVFFHSHSDAGRV